MTCAFSSWLAPDPISKPPFKGGYDGIFLQQDTYLGESNTPPSLHRYLYSYNNPTVYIDPDGHSATVVGGITGFFWGFGQMVGSMAQDVINDEHHSTKEYLGVWGQNIIGGIELGASIDVAVMTGGTGAVLSGALGAAGFEALTFKGRADESIGQFAKHQGVSAAVGGVLGPVAAKAAPVLGSALSKVPGSKAVMGGLQKAGQKVAEKSVALDKAVMSEFSRDSLSKTGQGVQRILNRAANKARPKVTVENFAGDKATTVVKAAKPQNSLTGPAKPKVGVGAAKNRASFFDELAEQATKNPNSNRIVLGKSLQDGKSYTKVGAHYKASYFKMENWRELSKTLTQDELWKINEVFLRQQIKQGKQIILSHDPSKATGYFAREVKFLKKLEYRFVQDGWVWRAIK